MGVVIPDQAWLSVVRYGSSGRGTAVVVFESEDAARSAAAEAQPPGDLMTFDSVEVGEVVANA